MSDHHQVFICGEFLPPSNKPKKRAGELNIGIFENLKKKFAISQDKKVTSHQI
jgi:hypothetical protein